MPYFRTVVAYSLPCLVRRIHSINSSLKSNGTLLTNSCFFSLPPSTHRKSSKEIQHTSRFQIPWQTSRVSSLAQSKTRAIHFGWFPLIPPGAYGCLCKDEYIASSGTSAFLKNSKKSFPIWLRRTNSTNSRIAMIKVDPL